MPSGCKSNASPTPENHQRKLERNARRYERLRQEAAGGHGYPIHRVIHFSDLNMTWAPKKVAEVSGYFREI